LKSNQEAPGIFHRRQDAALVTIVEKHLEAKFAQTSGRAPPCSRDSGRAGALMPSCLVLAQGLDQRRHHLWRHRESTLPRLLQMIVLGDEIEIQAPEAST
jgi:hypothetical protein